MIHVSNPGGESSGHNSTVPQDDIPEPIQQIIEERFRRSRTNQMIRTGSFLLGFSLAAALVLAWVGGWVMGQRGQPIAIGVDPTGTQTGVALPPTTQKDLKNLSPAELEADRIRFSDDVSKAWAQVAVKKDAASFDRVKLMIEKRLESDPTFVHMRLPYLAFHCDFLTGLGAGLDSEDKVKRIDHALKFIDDHGGTKGMDDGQADGVTNMRKQLLDLRKTQSAVK